MKSFFLATLISTISISAFGQLSKSTWLVGGSGSFYSYNESFTLPTVSSTGKYTSIDLTASIGYFIIDKFSIGLRPYLSTYKGTSSGGSSPSSLRFAVGPFARYYFLKEDKQFNLLTDVSYQIGINQAYDGDKPKGKFNVFTVMAGPEMFFNSTVGLEILLGYKNQLVTFDNSPSAFSNNRKGFQISIGFQIHLEKN